VRWSPGQKPGMPASDNPAEPVTVVRTEPRWFGVPPPLVLLGLTFVCLLLAVVLFAVGAWPAGLVLLVLSALFGAAFLEIARRRPDSALTRASARAAAEARSWASARLELVRARTSSIAEAQRVLGARAVIESERRMARLRLGEALASEDEEAAGAAQERLAALSRAEEALGGRLQAGRARADERVRRVRLATEQTLVVPPKPEPYPPPDEGDPPVPAPVPEPMPQRGADSRRPAA